MDQEEVNNNNAPDGAGEEENVSAPVTMPDSVWISNGASILKNSRSPRKSRGTTTTKAVKWSEVNEVSPPPPKHTNKKASSRDVLTRAAAVPPRGRNQWPLSYRYSWLNGAYMLLAEAWCSGLWSVSLIFAWLLDSTIAGFVAYVALVYPVYAVITATGPAHYAPRFVGSIPMYDLLFRDEKLIGKPRTYVLETRAMCAGRLAAQFAGGIVGGAVVAFAFPGAAAYLQAHYRAEAISIEDGGSSAQYIFLLYVSMYFLCVSVLGGLGLMLRRMTDSDRANTSTVRLFIMTGVPLLSYLAYPGMGIAFSYPSWLWMTHVFRFYSFISLVSMHAGLVMETGLAALVEDIIYTTAANQRAESRRASVHK